MRTVEQKRPEKKIETLRLAASHVEKVGLNKGEMFDYDVMTLDRNAVACCSMGALMVGCDLSKSNWVLEAELYSEVADHVGAKRDKGDTKHALAVWSDAPERTVEDVASAFRSYADELSAVAA